MPKRSKGLAISLAVLVLGIAYVIYIIQGGGQGDEQGGGPQLLQATGPAVIELGERVYAESCAACHGVDLEGEPGFDWREKKPDGTFPAPPHDETGHTWHHPDTLLFAYTANGGQVFMGDVSKSGMPAFADVLTFQEIEAVLVYIKSTWPEAIRERQRLVTEAARNQ